MAKENICAKLLKGQDNSCEAPISRYVQQMVVINKSDIEDYTIESSNEVAGGCKHNVKFKLKAGKEGVRFSMNENGTSISGTYEKTNNDFGNPMFNHVLNLAVSGADEESKCILEAISKGSFVVALQFGKTIEIYGIENGLGAGDYTYDPQGNSGFTPLTLTSGDGKNERYTPLVYVSEVPGSEEEDFDSNFKAA